ncbi:MAG: Rrf2 family transcriptional regulator, partial [Bacteroidetes bacterium]|nr:Rrf2 family transcriptional regulator [Bacteroidota bacterium]
AKYAIKTILYLCRNGNNQAISAKKIAEEENIPYKFLENILRELRQHKILKSVRGPEGGYILISHPKDIKVVEIVRIVDGPIALIPCVSENFYEKCEECTDEQTCQIRKLFDELRNAMLPIFNKSLEELKNL